MEETATTIDDPRFGPLMWDRIEHAWLGRARLNDLLNFGSALRDAPEGLIRDAYDPQKLFHEGAFRMDVRPGGGAPKQPPSHEQRDAWQMFLGNQDRIIGQIMERALEAYVRQRPARIYWWEKMYGADDPLLAESLPEIRTVAELRKLVRPYRIIIWETIERLPPPAWIVIQFDASWDRATGFAARVREGQIVSFGSSDMTKSWPSTDPVIDVPQFGPLRCHTGRTWNGAVHFEPFARMQCMIDQREQNEMFRKSPVFRPAPDWDFVDGDFSLEMISPQEGRVAPEQIEAVNAFMRDPQQSADSVLAAIFQQYQGYVDRLHDEIGEEEAEQIMPRIDSPAGLRDLITFQTMTISTPADEDETAFVGLGFACSWDEEHGLYVRWRDGKVEEVGGVETIM